MSTNPLSDVDSWLYHLGDLDDDEIAEIAAHDADLLVIDHANYAGEETPYTSEQINIMRGEGDKIIVSYLSIGEAEDYRFYWDDPDFVAIRDQIIDNENSEWEGNFKVKYWLDEWQQVIFQYVDRIIDADFNGVYLDIIDAFEYWEEEAPNSGIDYRQEMADFVAAIRTYAETRLADDGNDAAFIIIGQNGEDLIENLTYLQAIDGIGKEDLQFYYQNDNESSFREQDSDAVDWSLGYLLAAEAAGVEVFVIEYLTAVRVSQFEDTLVSHASALEEAGIPLYIAQNRNLDEIFSQPSAAIITDAHEGSAGNDILRGDFGRDIIMGAAGHDQIWAGADDAGDDLFVGGAGNDKIGGGRGDDFIIGGGATEGATEDWLPFNENTSLAGADTLFGGSGNDTLLGGGWNDALIADNGQYDDGEADTTASGENKIWAGAGDDIAIGAADNDAIGGGVGSDTLSGHGGNDSIYGSTDGDKITGGDGNDKLFGGTGEHSDSIWGNEGDDTLFGGAGDDLIDGGQGNNLVYGGSGDDQISSSGNDTLYGGAGSDSFSFSGEDSNAIIMDFDLDADFLSLADIQNPFTGLAELVNASTNAVQNGQQGVLVDLGENGVLFLVGLTTDDLQEIAITL
ncbi:MAG: endo alpha-1,4 polygalactosaminidase [Alphaproteobacteria bacterium]|nr:endo alpha-1,4 polygalactosaminidase [Alphaproteobacteria bacterium]